METYALNAAVRKPEEVVKKFKHQNKLAGVVYGGHQESISLVMDYSEFLKTFRKSGESQIIELKVGKDVLDVLVHQIQQHPVTGDYTHIDFYAVTKGEKLTTNISVHFVGTAPAAKTNCVVSEMIKEIEVKCLPKHLVESFEVDISSIKEDGDAIRIEDMNLGENYELVSLSPEDVVVSATMTREEVIEDSAPEADIPESENGGDDSAQDGDVTEEKA